VGYYVNGSVEIKANQENLTTAALLFDSIADRYHKFNSIRDDYGRAEGSIIIRALAASGFDGPREEVLEDGTLVYSAYYDEKWWEQSDFIHFLAAESGMSIRGEFRGEDDMGWSWYAEGGRALEDGLHNISGKDLEQLRAAESLVESVRSLLAEEQDRNPDEVLQKLRGLLAVGDLKKVSVTAD